MFLKSACTFVSMAGMLFTVNAAAISINGTVSDKTTQAPIQGAIVSLADTALTCITDPSGRYSFGDPVANLSPDLLSFALSPCRPVFANNRLVIDIQENGMPVRVDLYTLAGRHTRTIIDGKLIKGIHRFDPLSGFRASQLYVVKVQAGTAVTYLKATLIAGERIVAEVRVGANRPAGEASLSKTGAVTDTLSAWAVGYDIGRANVENSSGTYTIALQRTVPAGQAQVILSSQAGDKLMRNANLTFMADDGSALPTITVTPATTYQSITGFGASFTETATYVLARISAAKRAEVLNAFFNPYTGSGYTLCRTAIHSCDFSVSSYSYDDTPNDFALNNFNFSHELQWTVPVIKEAMRIRGADVKLFASPWSPPGWMKTNNSMLNGGKLKSDCGAAWALYFVKYIQAMKSNGIPMWGVTIQNEPAATQTWESCIFTATEERDFLKTYLGPTLATNNTNVKVMIWDHNKDVIVDRVRGVMNDANAAKYVWGVAYHKYAGDQYPNMDIVHNEFPNAWMVGTECSIRDTGTDAERMAHEIIGDLNHWSTGYLAWNLSTDYVGGPYHDRSGGCPGPIVVDQATNGAKYLRHYYYMTHFSRYLRPGAVRIGCALSGGSSLEMCAFRNADGIIVVTVLNRTNAATSFKIKQGSQIIKSTIAAYALMNFVF
jgi:glucosylceramidase